MSEWPWLFDTDANDTTDGDVSAPCPDNNTTVMAPTDSTEAMPPTQAVSVVPLFNSGLSPRSTLRCRLTARSSDKKKPLVL